MVWKDFLKAAIGKVGSTSQKKGKKILWVWMKGLEASFMCWGADALNMCPQSICHHFACSRLLHVFGWQLCPADWNVFSCNLSQPLLLHTWAIIMVPKVQKMEFVVIHVCNTYTLWYPTLCWSPYKRREQDGDQICCKCRREQFGHYFREGIILVWKLRSRGVKSSL